jgi:formylglycine-generating enzyme required for sulfatase activity
MNNLRCSIMTVLAVLAALTALGMLSLNPAYAEPGDYDPVTGVPNCAKCHTPDRRFSIDYTRDQTCAECHGPGLSEKYLSIHDRYPGSVEIAQNRQRTEAALTEAEKREKKKRELEKIIKFPGPKSLKEARQMGLVPAGEFRMGSDDWWPKSQPEHTRRLNAFYVDKYEVTNRRYREFVDRTGRPAPKHWPEGRIPQGKEDHPVVFVNWYDSNDFCRWEGKRLPTEPEWEKAARGTDSRTFPWGDKFSKFKGNTPQLGYGESMPVGTFEQGKSPYGAYDMAGNVFEWTADCFKAYPGNQHQDENYGEKAKVVRGGSWYDCTYYKCGISAPAFNRIFFNPRTKNNNFGFRCAKDK